ncbi:MAG: 8-oxoguanine deaminase [Pseudomonadota bacterium]
MSALLIRNARVVATMDDAGSELADADIVLRDGRIVGFDAAAAGDAAVLDATGCVVTPGLINTHHHMFQSLTRAVPAGQDAPLFDWLRALYPIWARMGPEDIFVSTQLALAELALSGCTLSADHLYLFPNGARLDDSIAAAAQIGLRFHPTRGSMSIGQSAGGLPPDALVEAEPQILNDTVRVIDTFHDPHPDAMVRVAVAPCSPFSVSQGLMRDSAALARDKGVRLHTHLAENDQDIQFSQDRFGCRPGIYAEDLGWVGSDVWHAHCIKLDTREIALFAGTGTGVAHCPCSNARLASGIAPVMAMTAAGVPVGLGVDGSASNDSGHLLAEARQAVLMQRLAGGAAAMGARAALRLATRGGAAVLGWPEAGQIVPGALADLAVWDTAALPLAGAWDPVASLVLCGPPPVRDLIVGGRPVVRDGRLLTADTRAIAGHAAARVTALMA